MSTPMWFYQIYGFWVISGASHVPIRGIRANKRKAVVWMKTHTGVLVLFWIDSFLVVSTFVISLSATTLVDFLLVELADFLDFTAFVLVVSFLTGIVALLCFSVLVSSSDFFTGYVGFFFCSALYFTYCLVDGLTCFSAQYFIVYFLA